MPISTLAVEPTGRSSANRAALVRCIDDLETPAVGTWLVEPASFLEVARPGDHPARLTVVGGALEVRESLLESELALRFASPTAALTMQPSRVAADPHGMSTWTFAGVLASGETQRSATITVTYHGVFRRSGGVAWSWFSGSGEIDNARPAGRWRRRSVRTRLVADLLFTP
jgi:hypothetical protein